MKKNIVAFVVLSIFLLSSSLYAAHNKSQNKKQNLGKDPISWSLSPSSGFPAQSSIGSSYAVAYTMTNNLPLAVPLTVSAAYNGGKFSLLNNCNTTLKPKGTCTVNLRFQPVTARAHSAVITLAYNRNRVPLPQLSSTSVSQETANRISGIVSTPLPAASNVGSTYPVTFTFVNNGNTGVATTAVNIVGFTPTSNSCSVSIAEHSNCSVNGNYTPGGTGTATLSVTYAYSGGSVPLSTATITNGTGGCLSPEAALPLPGSTLQYADNVVKYTFTNNCSTAQSINSVNVTSDSTSASPPTITLGKASQGLNTCSGSLASGASCAVYASVIPTSTYAAGNDLSVTATLTPSNGPIADITSSETVSAITGNQGPSANHTVMIVNQCPQTVWYGFQQAGTGDPTNNSSWQSYQLDQQITGGAPSPQSMQVLSIPQYNGGKMFGRTGCETDPSQSSTYGTCNTANCTKVGTTNGTCSTGTANGVASPYTAFEENLYTAASMTADGVYDVSIINGFNIPGEFRSLSPYVTVGSTSNFSNTCGNSAGAIIQPSDSALGACSWSFTPPSSGAPDCNATTETDNTSNYYYVTPTTTPTACTPGSCGGSQVCGMSLTPQVPPSSNPIYLGAPITQTCGAFQGYWTVADWVGYSSGGQWGTCNLYSHYNMTAALDTISGGQSTYGFSTLSPSTTPSLPAAMLADMYACQPTSQLSCYSNASPACFNHNAPVNNPYFALNTGYGFTYNVCGCVNWNASSTPASAQTAQASQCTADNTLWENKVYPRILWLKKACPTAYSFQFDDKSSSFQCNVTPPAPAPTPQLTAYQLTFCPGGKTGAPGT